MMFIFYFVFLFSTNICQVFAFYFERQSLTQIMPGLKSRNWSPQEDKLLVQTVLIHYKTKKSTWNEIAQIMTTQSVGFKKTGKQCRQRWTNQLDPEVKGNSEWSYQQNQTLFNQHDRVGNKWAQISALLPGRTDNCVKNHFYSTLRKGLRKINNYIETIKRKQSLVKTFKNQILNKILLLSEGKYDQKFQFTQEAKDLSYKIKKNLTVVAFHGQDDPQINTKKEQVFKMISEFSRNCRKKKAKKINHNLPSDLSMEIEEFCQNQNSQQVQMNLQKPQNNYFQGSKELKPDQINNQKNEKKPIETSQIQYKEFKPIKTSFSKLKKVDSLKSNLSESFIIKLDQEDNHIKDQQNLNLINFNFSSLKSFPNSFENAHKFSMSMLSSQLQNENNMESNQNSIIQMIQRSELQNKTNHVYENIHANFSKIGFCSGASSSFSVFQPSQANMADLSNIKEKGQIIFDKQNQLQDKYKVSNCQISQNQQKNQKCLKNTCCISESPLFNQFIENHLNKFLNTQEFIKNKGPSQSENNNDSILINKNFSKQLVDAKQSQQYSNKCQ